MPLYPFEMQIAVDANNAETVVRSGSVTICDPADATNSPIPLLDATGTPMANPIQTTLQGFVPAFQATIPHVKWAGGGFAGYLSSYKGLLDEATAAKQAALDALNASSPLPTGGTAGQVLTKVSGTTGHTTWRSPIVVIGPTDPWPTGLPEGTLVVRTEA